MPYDEQAAIDAKRIVRAQQALTAALTENFQGPVSRYADEVAAFATAFFEKRGGVK
jgi:hypothetical protein